MSVMTLAMLAFAFPFQAGRGPEELVGADLHPDGPAYTPEEIIDEIRDMFGDEAADEIEASGVGIVEVDYPNHPTHDRNTIGVETRPPQGAPDVGDGPLFPLSVVAMHAYHEFQHTKNCGLEDTFDPTTRKQPPGSQPGDCNHAQMHVDAAEKALAENSGNLSVAQCYAVAKALRAADHHGGLCQKYGGTPPPDYDAVRVMWMEECL